MQNRRIFTLLIALVVFTLGFGLSAGNAQQSSRTYIARLMPLNSSVTMHKAAGELKIVSSGDTLTITLHAKGLPPGMMHMAHLHGFVDGKDAACPTEKADANHDGIIDLKETEPEAGTTLIPFNGDPAALEITGPGYPSAGKNGRLHYEHQVSLPELESNLARSFHGAAPELDHGVVFIHGVPADAKLPATVESLPGVPAQATLPIACGKLELEK